MARLDGVADVHVDGTWADVGLDVRAMAHELAVHPDPRFGLGRHAVDSGQLACGLTGHIDFESIPEDARVGMPPLVQVFPLGEKWAGRERGFPVVIVKFGPLPAFEAAIVTGVYAELCLFREHGNHLSLAAGGRCRHLPVVVASH